MEVQNSCSSSGGATGMMSLHSDIIRSHILTKLDGPSLAATSCSCRQLHTLCSDENLWKNICNTTFPSTTDPRVHNLISGFPSGHRSFYSDTFPTVHHRSCRQLHTLCSDENLWTNTSNTTIPSTTGPRVHNMISSFPFGHRSFYSDTFPTLHYQPSESKIRKECTTEKTRELISAVDVKFGDNLVYSKVVVTDIQLVSSLFTIELIGEEEFFSFPAKDVVGNESEVMKTLNEELKLSWIIIDPTRKRAINLSSHVPMNVRRHPSISKVIVVRYATVIAAAGAEGGYVSYVVRVTCKGKGGKLYVWEISMEGENIEGGTMNGKDSLVILHEAMEGERSKREINKEKKRFDNFSEVKSTWRRKSELENFKDEDDYLLRDLLLNLYL